MKRVWLIAAALVLLLAQQASAAGSIVITTVTEEPDVTEYAIAWTATSGGAVSGNMTNVRAGYIFRVQFIPGATTPTTLYDVTLVDQRGTIDMLVGMGANLSATVSLMAEYFPAIHWRGGPLELVVANAGTSTNGTVIIWVRGVR